MLKRKLQALAVVLICALLLYVIVSARTRLENLEQRVERLEKKTEPHLELIHK